MWRGFISIPQAAETEAARREGVQKRDRKKDHSLSLLTRPGLSPHPAGLCSVPAAGTAREPRGPGPDATPTLESHPRPTGRARRGRGAPFQPPRDPQPGRGRVPGTLRAPERPSPWNTVPLPPKARAALREPSWGPRGAWSGAGGHKPCWEGAAGGAGGGSGDGEATEPRLSLAEVLRRGQVLLERVGGLETTISAPWSVRALAFARNVSL